MDGLCKPSPSGEGCPICQIFGPPNKVLVYIKDNNHWKPMIISKELYEKMWFNKDVQKKQKDR